MRWIVLVTLTAGFFLGQPRAAQAQVPLAVAESEVFEAVGRLGEEGLSWFVDRAETNLPVLGATLDVEFAGKSVPAVFRPEQGDYLIADADWLRALREPGRHALALTLLAGEESDLLAAELQVAVTEDQPPTSGLLGQASLAALLILALVLVGRRVRQRGAA